MALPIWLTWNVQMPTSKKVSIRVLFGSGFICILFASVRVAQVAINAARPRADNQTLDPTWLAIWGMVECSIGALDIREPVRTKLISSQPSSSDLVLPSPSSSTPSDRRLRTTRAAIANKLAVMRTRKARVEWSLRPSEVRVLELQTHIGRVLSMMGLWSRPRLS
jgi:hypothetical protein